ncbi:NAD-dependent epimerase/dehydratase family protein [Falsiroseomonas oryzae]|uniref:NAD-dependent epimerase/dehydratase family protein n=1 Tax=Falsiroseomonas oryzae TaxID=2766473 RepID=UPI0022EB70CB|nr:NAD(P)-dependent oxidoreductase [Roseomonas sp. MO-31]
MPDAPRWRRLLLTGAAGEIGTVLRPALRGTAAELRLHDIRPVASLAAGETAMGGDIADPAVATAAMEGVECVVHLAGIPRETGGTPEQILHANVIGAHAVFDAAREAGVRRFVFASSNHTIGFHPADRPVGTEERPRPSGLYGASKVWGEALGRLYADKYGMEVACLRIGAFRAKPGNARELGGWISHRDMAELARCCVTAPAFHFLVLYGVSANTRAKWGGDEAARAHVGFVPQDDAEAWAAELEKVAPPPGSVAARFHGGAVCELGFAGDPDRIS